MSAAHICAVALLVIFAVTAPVMAEHFEFDLTIDDGQHKSHGSADEAPPAMGFKPREVMHVKKAQPLVFQFFMNSNFPHDTLKNVGVLYYITPMEKVGQNTLPALGEGTVLEGHFVMDFKPNTGRVGVRQQLRIDKPGVYLVRVESEHSESDHEHFSAMELVVE